MIVTVSRTITRDVIEFYMGQDFIIPDSMANATNEEILKYLENSDKLDDADWDLVKDNYSNSRYEFALEWREEIPEDDGTNG